MPPSKKSKTSFRSWISSHSPEILYSLLGYCSGLYLSFNFGSVSFYLVLIFSLLLFASAIKKPRRLILSLSFFALGVLLVALSWPDSNGVGTVRGIVIESKANYFLFYSGGHRYYVYEKATSREIGDIITIYGKKKDLLFTVYESRFDFGAYLSSRGVNKELTAYSVKEVFLMPLRLRSYEKAFISSVSGDAGVLLSSLLFDLKDYSSLTINQASSVGALYFLGASGLYFSLYLSLSEKAARHFMNEKKSRILSIALGALLVPLTPSKIGVWRVLLARIVSLTLTEGEKRPPRYLPTSLAGLVLCLFDFLSPLRQGFLLGVGLSLFLAFSDGYLMRFSGRKKKLLSKALLFAFILPIHVDGGSFHLLQPFYGSILIVPLSLFSIVGLVSFFSYPFSSLLNGLAVPIVWLIEAFSKVDITIPIGGDISNALIFIYYFCLCLTMFFLEVGFPKFGKIAFGALAVLVGLNALPLGQGASSQVSFINVGQGDAILIRDGYTYAMIDTGGNITFDLASEVDVPFLKKERVYHLDALIASHGDYDHIGAASSLSKQIPIHNYVDSAASFPLTVGRMVFNNYNVYDIESEDANDKSLVLSLRLGERVFLFTGDAPLSIEKKIIADHPSLDCDILKLGHHGSSTSSSEEFLRALSPSVAIISVAAKNTYGHPSKEVITRLESLKIPYRRTDEEGTITYRSYLSLPMH